MEEQREQQVLSKFMGEQQAQAAAPQEEQRQLPQQMVSRIMDVGPIPSRPSNWVLPEQEPTRCWLQAYTVNLSSEAGGGQASQPL